MKNRNKIRISVILLLLFVDVLIYKIQKEVSAKGTIRCYPYSSAESPARDSAAVLILYTSGADASVFSG